MHREKINGLYVIIGDGGRPGRDPVSVAEAAIRGGARIIQLRDKSHTARELYHLALSLRKVCGEHGALFIVNDSVELTLATDADGVHLGQDDLPLDAARRLMGSDRIIGVSTHSVAEALEAGKGGADYIGFGPMFPTATKQVASPVKGPEGLRELRGLTKLPIAAIGGINAGNAREVLEAGADALAVISAVTGAEDVEKAARGIVQNVAARRLGAHRFSSL